MRNMKSFRAKRGIWYPGRGTGRSIAMPDSSLTLGMTGAALLALLLAACSKQEAPKTPPVPVETARASTIAAPLTIEANGVVEPLQTVAVQAQVGGTLE